MQSKLSVVFLVILMMQVNSIGSVPRDGKRLIKMGMVLANVVTEGIQIGECLVVHSDGSYHLERRIQHMPNPNNNLEVYEGKTDARWIDELVKVLDDPKVKDLPDYIPPKFPISTSTFEMLSAEFTVNDVQRHMGYFRFFGEGTPGTSPANTPDDIKTDWHTSESGLQPLISWFRGFEKSGLQRVTYETASLSCN